MQFGKNIKGINPEVKSVTEIDLDPNFAAG
jgi:hypothetical protein